MPRLQRPAAQPAAVRAADHEDPLHARTGRAALALRVDLDLLRRDEALPGQGRPPAPHGLPRDEGAQPVGRGGDHRDGDAHQGHELQARPLPRQRDPRALQDHLTHRPDHARPDRAPPQAGARRQKRVRRRVRARLGDPADPRERRGGQALGQRGADRAAVRQPDGAVPRARAAAHDQKAGPARRLQDRRQPRARADQVAARAVPAHPLRQEGDGRGRVRAAAGPAPGAPRPRARRCRGRLSAGARPGRPALCEGPRAWRAAEWRARRPRAHGRAADPPRPSRPPGWPRRARARSRAALRRPRVRAAAAASATARSSSSSRARCGTSRTW